MTKNKSSREIFSLEHKDIVSLTGAGGKTSLMLALAKDLSQDGQVLLTTSTKLSAEKMKTIDQVTYEAYIKDRKAYKKSKELLISHGPNDQGKLLGLTEDEIFKIKDDFAYVLIEADGSRRLLFKFWQDWEPTIAKFTTKTIGIFSIEVYGKKFGPDNTYNYEKGVDYSRTNIIDSNLLYKLLADDKTYFKNSRGKNYFYISHVDKEEEKILAEKLIGSLRPRIKNISFAYGSVKGETYYEA